MATTEELARRMAQPIPAPRRAAPRPQKSWRTLNVGQHLQNLDRMVLEGRLVPKGRSWEVMHCTDQGALLRLVETAPNPYLDYHLTTYNWQGYFVRVRRPTKRRKPSGA